MSAESWPMRVWVNDEREFLTDNISSDCIEYLSLAEHTAIVEKAVRDAKAEAFEEAAHECFLRIIAPGDRTEICQKLFDKKAAAIKGRDAK